LTILARRKSSTPAAPTAIVIGRVKERAACATIANRTAAATPTPKTASLTTISGQSSPSPSSPDVWSNVAASATHRSIVLKGAVFDGKLTRTSDINGATCAQAATATAHTAISPLYVEAFDVNIFERQLSDSVSNNAWVGGPGDHEQARVDRHKPVHPLQCCAVTLDDDFRENERRGRRPIDILGVSPRMIECKDSPGG
jgi:hypothetical protein